MYYLRNLLIIFLCIFNYATASSDKSGFPVGYIEAGRAFYNLPLDDATFAQYIELYLNPPHVPVEAPNNHVLLPANTDEDSVSRATKRTNNNWSKKHEREKSEGKRPFVCQHPGCLWAFKQERYLKGHQTVHQAE